MSDTATKLGRFTVRIGLRPDNPAFPCYLIFIGNRLIGRQFSMPSETDCAWVLRQNGKYADQSEHARQAYGWTAMQMRRNDRQRRREEEGAEADSTIEAS